jgi:hypothetical protein
LNRRDTLDGATPAHIVNSPITRPDKGASASTPPLKDNYTLVSEESHSTSDVETTTPLLTGLKCISGFGRCLSKDPEREYVALDEKFLYWTVIFTGY